MVLHQAYSLPNPIRWPSWEAITTSRQTPIPSSTHPSDRKCTCERFECDSNELQVQVEGFKPITTQIFDKDSKYLDDDSVFAVKDSLIVEFVPRKGDSKATHELQYDIAMAPMGDNVPEGTELAPSGAYAA